MTGRKTIGRDQKTLNGRVGVKRKMSLKMMSAGYEPRGFLSICKSYPPGREGQNRWERVFD